MPQPKKGPRFGGTSSHHDHIMSNLATELIRHGRINTTYAKAKTVQPLAERMITFAKRGDVHSRRQVLRVIRDKDVVHKLFTDVGPAFAQRDGGYTRVLKTGPRKGDAALMAIIELVEGVEVAGRRGALEEEPRRRWSLRRRRGTQSVSARERAEDRAAAIDRGEAPDEREPEEAEEAEAPAAAEADVEEGPEVDPSEVEARLAAEDEAQVADDEAREIAEQTDTASPSVEADEEAQEIAEQADSEVSPSEWNADEVEEAPRSGDDKDTS